jgi:hypothetical protein
MVTTLNRQNPPSFDAAPTEVQMKLGISQVLSMPFAYNSPVIVLDFEVGNKNIIKGRFKDAIRSRVFEFEIGDSITFKPFTWKRTDSLDVDPVAWEDYSKGYCYRFDVAKTVRKEKPKCGNTSYNCGKACIGLNKNCKSDLPDKPSQEKVDKLRAAAGKFKSKAEILVAKDARHKVKSVTEKDGIIYVQTEEITNSDADKKIAPTAVQDFTAPRTLGNGTHEGTPKNAQEYSDMMAKKGQKIGIQDAEGVIESVKEWSENAYEIREDQKNGRSSKDADNLDLFIKQSTPFPGEISRGLKFDSEEELNKFVKGEDGILGNQNAHASWTSNYEKAKDFAGMNLSSVKKTYPVIVKAPNKSGVSIRNLSTFGQGEDEVVVSKNTRHKIKSVRKEGDLTIIETEEI